jgi:hypothetical protein
VKQWNAVRSERAAAGKQLDEQRAGYEKALVDVRTEEREYREKLREALDASQANALRLSERVSLLEGLRDGQEKVRKGLPVGISGVAPQGVMDGWTNGVIRSLEALGKDTSGLRSWGVPIANRQSPSHAEVLAEFQRRIDVVDSLIEAGL